MKRTLSTILLLMTLSAAALAGERVEQVVVLKSDRLMHLMSGGEIVRTYPVALGAAPTGHKEQEGDERTSEGRYVLYWRNPGSAYHRSIHISYPNAADRAAAASRGVDPGGMIMIHGQRNGLGWLSWIVQRFDWTDGCIAVSNADMDEIWHLVANGTPIDIRP